MKQKYTKSTKTTKTITWDITIQSDEGESIAYMTALLDAAHPRGFVNMVVKNQSLYEANKAEVDSTYATFNNEVSAAADEEAGALINTYTIERGGNEYAMSVMDEDGAE